MGSTPLTLRCPKCKKFRDYKRGETESSSNLEPTGRVKLNCTVALARGHVYNRTKIEMRHKPCGTVFWTTHPSVTGNKRNIG